MEGGLGAAEIAGSLTYPMLISNLDTEFRPKCEPLAVGTIFRAVCIAVTSDCRNVSAMGSCLDVRINIMLRCIHHT